MPQPEICGNGIDEDCDGEDWACPDSAVHVDNVRGSDAGDGSEAQPVRTIAQGLELASSGTTIFVHATDQGYEGACVLLDGVWIVGSGGQPVVDSYVSCDGRNSLLFSRADDVRIENLRLDASAFSGESVRALLFSGLPEAPIHRNEARFVDALGPGQGSSGRSLISSSLCYDCLLEHASSIGAEEHGVYWTNHQDGSVIRDVYIRDSDGACLQFNADPETYTPGHPFQDGLMSGGLVEDNVFEDCGTGNGGAAVNLAGVRDTTFRNNIVFGTQMNGGVAMWDDGYSDWGDAGNFDFGCRGNIFHHNTIDCRSCDRHAFSLRNGSTDNTVVDNIILHEQHDSMAVDQESLGGHDIDYNVYSDQAQFENTAGDWIDFAQWRALGFDAHSVQAPVDSLFVAPGAGDYHLAVGSPAIDVGIEVGVPVDIDGDARPNGAAPDPGADEF